MKQLEFLTYSLPNLKVVLRDPEQASLKSRISKILRDIPKYGELLCSKRLTEISHLFVFTFEDPVMADSWRNNFLNDSLEEVKQIRIMPFKRASSEELKQDYENLIALIPSYKCSIFKREKISEREYNVYLLFTDIEEMNRFISEQNVLV